ncbi:radical SAM protein [candidate division WOR-3 bacterium]|nr:radical SAM protein [candidate division WOR-3 bacterium]
MFKKVFFLKNILSTLSNYKRGKIHLSNPPLLAWVEINNICNLKCIMCPITFSTSRKKVIMSLAQLKQIVDQIKGFILEVYLFVGGEPLLHSDIISIIECCKTNGVEPVIHTNGVKLSDEISKALINFRVRNIFFSFDGYTKETYENIRVGANFENTIENINQLTAIKKEKKTTKPHIVIETLMDRVNIRPFTIEKEKKFKELFIDNNNISFTRKYISNFATEMPANEIYTFPKTVRGFTFTPCPNLWSSLNILSNGNVVPCCIDFNGENILGNINNESISKIWNGPKIKELRLKHFNGDIGDIPLCSKCGSVHRKNFHGIPFEFPGIGSFVRNTFNYDVYRAIWNRTVNL